MRSTGQQRRGRLYAEKAAGTLSGHRPGETLVVYARSSSDEQTESCTQQIADLEAYLRHTGVLVPDEKLPRRHAPTGGCFMDEGWSGWKYRLAERPAGAALLDFCTRHRPPGGRRGVILIWALSRLGRFPDGAMEAIHCIYELRKLGWWVRSVTQEGLDADDGNRLMPVIIAALEAEKDTSHSEEKSVSVNRGKQSALEEGRWAGGTAPFGYERWAARVDGRSVVEWIEPLPTGKRNGNHGSRTVLREGEHGRWVQWIFRCYLEREAGEASTQDGIAARLTELGIPLPTIQSGRKLRNGSDPHAGWGSTTVHKILTNEVYLGQYTDGEGRVLRTLWEPLVDPATWRDAQARLAANRVLRRSARTAFCLSGILSCAGCGQPFWGESGDGTNGHWSRYRPKMRSGRRSCAACRSSVRVEQVEEPVLNAIAGVADHPAVAEALRAELALRDGSHDARSAEIARLDAQYQEAEDAIQRMAEAIATGALLKEEAKPVAEEWRQRRDRAQSRRNGLISAPDTINAIEAHVATARSFRTLFQRATPREKKLLVRCFVSHVRVDVQAARAWVHFRRPA